MIEVRGSALTDADYERLGLSWIDRPSAEKALIRRVTTLEGAELVGQTDGHDYAGLIFPNVWPGESHVREYRLLEFLMRSAGRLCGRMMILEKVWDYGFDPGTNLVDVYIRRLREKIDADFEPKLLQTVRGAGYMLKETP